MIFTTQRAKMYIFFGYLQPNVRNYPTIYDIYRSIYDIYNPTCENIQLFTISADIFTISTSLGSHFTIPLEIPTVSFVNTIVTELIFTSHYIVFTTKFRESHIGEAKSTTYVINSSYLLLNFACLFILY